MNVFRGENTNTGEIDKAKIPVLLVDDHAIWRGGVRSMLEDTEFAVVGEASSGAEALSVARQTCPRLVLLDIRMHGRDGLDILVALKREHPHIAVIMLTTYDNPTFVARAVAGGAAGYLLKGVPQEEMLHILRTVLQNESVLSAKELVHSLQGISQEATKSRDLFVPLTQREQDVLPLVASGLCNREISVLLGVAESTVRTHVEHIIGKLGVSDRIQAAVWAVQLGITSLSEQ